VSDLLKSVIRTFVPVVVGLIISAVTLAGVEIDDELRGSLLILIDGVFVGLYYTLIRWLEGKFPAFGWFLGLPAEPHYTNIFTAKKGSSGTAS
jgi:hypothetical protein